MIWYNVGYCLHWPMHIITQYYLLTAITSLLLRVCCEIHHLNFIIAITSIVLWLLCHIGQPVAFGIINSILISISVVSFTCASLTSWIVSWFECGVIFISWTSLSLSLLSWCECAVIFISWPSLSPYYHFTRFMCAAIFINWTSLSLCDQCEGIRNKQLNIVWFNIIP